VSEIRKVGVLGCGLMGSGIAQVAAVAGFEVIARDLHQEQIAHGRKMVELSLAKFVEKGKLTPADRDATLGRLSRNMQELAAALKGKR